MRTFNLYGAWPIPLVVFSGLIRTMQYLDTRVHSFVFLVKMNRFTRPLAMITVSITM